MNNIDKAVVFLDSFDFATYKKKQNSLDLFKNPEDMLNIQKFEENKQKLLKIFSDEEFSIILGSLKCNNLSLIENKLNSLKINAISIFSNLYPKTLKNIDTPPLVIYYKGNINLLSTNCLFCNSGF